MKIVDVFCSRGFMIPNVVIIITGVKKSSDVARTLTT